jgi:DNA-binding MarR family transcriptional regulator
MTKTGQRRGRGPAPGVAAEELALVAVQLGRLAQGDSAARGLTPAQWGALRYFARANRFSRTVSALAAFQATTRGTVSQTVKGLVTRGYLRRTPSDRDGRSVRFDLTSAARQILARDPFQDVVRAAVALPAGQRNRLLSGLQALLQGAARVPTPQVPGRCGLCGHLGKGEGGRSFECGLLKEPLAAAELGEHCVRFSARA